MWVHSSRSFQFLTFGNGQSIVYKATEESSGRKVAVKKSRISRTVKRPTLQHETRVLQYVKGQAAIPTVYGYGQLEHFEYMTMELLGPSIAERQKDGAGVMVETAIRIVDQAVRGIQIQASYSTYSTHVARSIATLPLARHRAS